MNKADGGNRKFILVEMMDYADSITAERVKRVINGYGEGKKAVEGTGGNFSYYELGPVLLLPDGNLNEEVGPQKIREYVYYMETKEPLPAEQPTDEPYFMGLCRNTAYYFYYERENVTTLDHAFLATIQTKAEGYTIYADLCAIPQETLRKHNITFKKIPSGHCQAVKEREEMELKSYQKEVIADLARYLELVVELQSPAKAYQTLWNEKNVLVGFGGMPNYVNVLPGVPHVC